MPFNPNPYFSNTRERVLFLMGTWSWITKVIQSPAFKASSLLPVVGYIILYGDAFQGWFDFRVLGDDLILSTPLRLRFLYWGGVLILAAVALHTVFCPSIVKRFPDENDYIDNFIVAYSPWPVIEAIDSLSVLTKGHHSRAARFSNLFNPLVSSFKNPDPKFVSLVVKGIPNLDGMEYEQIRTMLLYLLDADRMGLNSKIHCVKLIEYNHAIQRASRPKIRVATVALAVIGVFLAAVPAIETFFRVLILDMSWVFDGV